MKTYKKLFAVLAAGALCSVHGASITTIDQPAVGNGNPAVITDVTNLGGVQTWSTSSLNFKNIFGFEFDASKHVVEITTISKDFGYSGSNVATFTNNLGASDAMHSVSAGYSTNVGSQSFITFFEGEQFQLFGYSGFLNESYALFDVANEAFAWTTADASLWHLEYADGTSELVTRAGTTLYLGFEDSGGVWDFDLNDTIFSVRVSDIAAPSGKPLPGVLMSFCIAGSLLTFFKKSRKKAK